MHNFGFEQKWNRKPGFKLRMDADIMFSTLIKENHHLSSQILTPKMDKMFDDIFIASN